MAWIWVAAVNTVTKNRHVGGPRLTHHEQFVNCTRKPFDGCFDFVGERVQKQHLRAHFINGNHSHNVARTCHSFPSHKTLHSRLIQHHRGLRCKNDANDAAAICEAVTPHRCILLRSRRNSNRLGETIRLVWWSQPVAATLYPDWERWSVWRCDKDTFGGSLRQRRLSFGIAGSVASR